MRLVKIGILLSLFAAGATASVLGFTFTGEATGALAGTTFTAADLVITGTYDTAAITQRSPAVYSVLVDSLFVAIHDMNKVTVNDPVYLFVNTGTRRVGINNNGVFGLYHATSLDRFGTWFLNTPIGPVDASTASIDSGPWSTQTSGGALTFTGSISSGTFTATDAIPEPGTFGLAGLGLAFAALRRRRNS